MMHFIYTVFTLYALASWIKKKKNPDVLKICIRQLIHHFMTAGKQNVIEINCNRLYRQFPFAQTVIPVWICFTSNQMNCICIPYYTRGFIVIKFFSVEEYKKADPSNIAMTEAGRVPSTNPLDNLDCKYMYHIVAFQIVACTLVYQCLKMGE